MDGIAHLLRNRHLQIPCPHCHRPVPVEADHLEQAPLRLCPNCRQTFELVPAALLESFKASLQR